MTSPQPPEAAVVLPHGQPPMTARGGTRVPDHVLRAIYGADYAGASAPSEVGLSSVPPRSPPPPPRSPLLSPLSPPSLLLSPIISPVRCLMPPRGLPDIARHVRECCFTITRGECLLSLSRGHPQHLRSRRRRRRLRPRRHHHQSGAVRREPQDLVEGRAASSNETYCAEHAHNLCYLLIVILHHLSDNLRSTSPNALTSITPTPFTISGRAFVIGGMHRGAYSQLSVCYAGSPTCLAGDTTRTPTCGCHVVAVSRFTMLPHARPSLPASVREWHRSPGLNTQFTDSSNHQTPMPPLNEYPPIITLATLAYGVCGPQE